MTLIPFFVADRPASLHILRGVMLKYPRIKVGIMTHAFTTQNFCEIFKNFPSGNGYPSDKENILANNLIKMADSGIFSKNGCSIDYKELFDTYNRLGVKFGVMIDVLKDPDRTIKSAIKGLKIYTKNKHKYRFRLVAVAQGNTVEEYVKCYYKLRSLGYDYIAIGGLLKKIENSTRYVKVRDENFMYRVLTAIREEFDPQWLFALGCYHPSRHKKFEEIGVWGSDYKGWIFNYRSKYESLNDVNKNLFSFEMANHLTDGLKLQLKQTNELEEKLKKLKKMWREEKNPHAKRDIRKKIGVVKDKLDVMYATLLNRREEVVSCNHLPPDYRDKLATFKMILNESEQEWRFRQVREYIERNIYDQFR